MSAIDWAKHDGYPENTITCLCDAVFRSHAKWTADKGIITRRPCPSCGSTEGMMSLRSDPEEMTLKR